MSHPDPHTLLDPRLAAWLVEPDPAALASLDAHEAAALAAGVLALVEAGPGYGAERARELALERGLLALAASLAEAAGDWAALARAVGALALREPVGSVARAVGLRRAWELGWRQPSGPGEALEEAALAEADGLGDAGWLAAIAEAGWGPAAPSGRGAWLWRGLRGWLPRAAPAEAAAVLEAWGRGARQAGCRAGLGWAGLAAAWHWQAVGRPAQALTRLDEGVALLAEAGDDEGLARALALRLRLCVEQEDEAEAGRVAEALARLAAGTRCPRARQVLESPFSD
ncbi:MAG: hypothetical protein VKS61_02700 [Candidatus Sericytochromatia bacterium]|nr:hypothetical protein [Candidatus Sericytochromatia bacterium]